MALNNYQKADRTRTDLHRAISNIYFQLNNQPAFCAHNAYPELKRARRLFLEASAYARKIRDDSQRHWMQSDLRGDQMQLWDAEDQLNAKMSLPAYL